VNRRATDHVRRLRTLAATAGTRVTTTSTPGCLTGCPCGCLNGEDCITHKLALDRNGHCCGSLTFGELHICTREGITCGPGRCARDELAGVA